MLTLRDKGTPTSLQRYLQYSRRRHTHNRVFISEGVGKENVAYLPIYPYIY